MSTYKAIVLNKRPETDIVVGETFRTVNRPRPTAESLSEGQVLIEALYLSLDPAMRGWLNDKRSYLPPVQIDEVMRGVVIARVLESKSSKVAAGDLVTSMSGWQEVAIVPEKDVTRFELPANGSVTDALGVLGATGLTAYFGLLEVGMPKAGELVVVSGAAGATGSVVVQIARLKGCRVVGIAGADDKCAWLRELGCEAALNYKSPSFEQDFRNATKGFIDVFFDNVGGDILDMALARAKPHARFVMCGAISQYNAGDEQAKGPKNITNVIAMRIKLQGFIVFDFAARYGEARKDLAQWLGEGKIQRKEHIIKGGLEAAPQGLRDLFRGVNTGKLLIEVKADQGVSKL